MKEIADRVRTRARAMAKSERAILEEAGLSESYLKDLRQGRIKSPTVLSLQALSRALGQSTVLYLLTGIDDEAFEAISQLDPTQRQAVANFARDLRRPGKTRRGG